MPPAFWLGCEALVLTFSAFGLRISRFDFFCDLAIGYSFVSEVKVRLHRFRMPYPALGMGGMGAIGGLGKAGSRASPAAGCALQHLRLEGALPIHVLRTNGSRG